MKDFIFKPHGDGYIWVDGGGKSHYFDRTKMKKIHECCHELEDRHPIYSPEGKRLPQLGDTVVFPVYDGKQTRTAVVTFIDKHGYHVLSQEPFSAWCIQADHITTIIPAVIPK